MSIHATLDKTHRMETRFLLLSMLNTIIGKYGAGEDVWLSTSHYGWFNNMNSFGFNLLF